MIFGGGGCAGDILRTARKLYQEIIIVADTPGGDVLGIRVEPPSAICAEDHLLVAIGAGAARRRIIERFPANQLATIVAPTAIVGDGVEIGDGTCLSDYAVITSQTRIGRNVHINLKSSIGHDCVIGDDVTISPHVAIGSFVEIGSGAFIGTGAVIANGGRGRIRRIGAGARVSSGSVVFQDVPANALVAGNPARVAKDFLS